jgi:hypothetical protein
MSAPTLPLANATVLGVSVLHTVALITIVVVLRCRLIDRHSGGWTAFFLKDLICILLLVVCVLSVVTVYCGHGWSGRLLHLRLPASKTRGSA